MGKWMIESSLLIENINETVQNEAKEQKDLFVKILLGTLGTNSLENLLTGKRPLA